jgi:hypothetical protein
MPDIRPATRTSPRLETPADANPALRELGARAHQLRAATRAADHYNAQSGSGDRDTASWLMSCALGLAGELADDIDSLARSLREGGNEVLHDQHVAPLRMRAHQLHAVTKAADHFLDQDSNEDRDTGSWLVASAHTLAQRLAAAIDDSVSPTRRPALEKDSIEPHDAALARRLAAATAPLRGAA